MKKKFYNLSLILIIVTACLSVAFALIYFFASGIIVEGDPMIIFLFYVKKFFDLLAVFTGYGTIIYAFSRYSYIDGLKMMGIFAISVLISFVYQVTGTCLFTDKEFTVELIVTSIYYSFGDCFITQYLPALIIALVAYKSTLDGTKPIKKFISWKNPTQRVMLLVTLVIFVINFVIQLIFDIIVFLIEVEWMIYIDELGSILLSILETVGIFIIFQYCIYMLLHYVYKKYTDHSGTGEKDKSLT